MSPTDNQIAAAYLEHGTGRRTAKALGISEHCVLIVARARGLKSPRRSRYRTDDEFASGVVAMHKLGHDPAEIARRTERPVAAVRALMEARGIDPHAEGHYDPSERRVRRCSRTGCGVCVEADESICADCLPRFDARPVQRAGARLDHDAMGRGEL